jgi:hypothetical protein
MKAYIQQHALTPNLIKRAHLVMLSGNPVAVYDGSEEGFKATVEALGFSIEDPRIATGTLMEKNGAKSRKLSRAAERTKQFRQVKAKNERIIKQATQNNVVSITKNVKSKRAKKFLRTLKARIA